MLKLEKAGAPSGGNVNLYRQQSSSLVLWVCANLTLFGQLKQIKPPAPRPTACRSEVQPKMNSS
jgi:hypothetical protein